MIGLKIKIKKKRKKKNSTGLQKTNVDAEVYNNNKKNVTERKQANKLKSLVRFHSANKIDNYNGWGGRKNIQKNLQNKSKHKNDKYFFS